MERSTREKTPEQVIAHRDASRRYRAKHKKARVAGLQPGTPAFRARNNAKLRRWRADNPDRNAEYHRAYYRKDPAAKRVQTAKRRALKKAALCDCCQSPDAKTNFVVTYALAKKLKLHVDHIQPLAKGGKHCLLNLQLLTPLANRKKAAKWQEAA